MAAALVPGQHASASLATPASAISVSFPAGTGPGNLICVVSMCNSAQNPTLPTDDKSDSYAISAPQTVETAGTQVVTGYYAKNCASGAVAVTGHFSASTAFSGIAISEYSGLDTVAPLDQVGGLYTPGPTADALSPSRTPAADGSLIWGGCVNNIGASNTTGTPFTLLDTDAAAGHAHEYFIQGSAASISAEFKAGSTGAWAVLIATFAPPPGQPVSPQSGQWGAGFQAVIEGGEVASGQPPGLLGGFVRTLETFPLLPSTTPAVGGQGVITAVETQVFVVSDGT